ncbi:jumonji domain-containing protein 6 [Phlyctochytrium planicorne]|nr:jumonji domain-containing protein 6 [Phlyctochytrium planicorne]
MMMRKRRRSSTSPDRRDDEPGLGAMTKSSLLNIAQAYSSNVFGPQPPTNYNPSPSKISIPSTFQVRSSKYQRRLKRTKTDARSELDFENWSRFNYAKLNMWIDPSKDKVPRCDYHTCSDKDFIRLYEEPAIPVVITGAIDHWPAVTEWKPEKLLEHYHREKFKIGEDDDGDSVYMQFSHFIQYSLTSGDAERDDSPLYIFDSVFGDRTRNNSAKRIAKKKKDGDDKNADDETTAAAKAQKMNDMLQEPNDSLLQESNGSDDDADGEEEDERPMSKRDEMPDRKRPKYSDDSGNDTRSYKAASPPTERNPAPQETDASRAEGKQEKITITLPVPRKSSKPESRATKELLKDYEIPSIRVHEDRHIDGSSLDREDQGQESTWIPWEQARGMRWSMDIRGTYPIPCKC